MSSFSYSMSNLVRRIFVLPLYNLEKVGFVKHVLVLSGNVQVPYYTESTLGYAPSVGHVGLPSMLIGDL